MRRILEKAVTFSLLLLVMGSFSNLFFGAALREGSDSPTQSHFALSALELLIYVGCGSFALMRYKKMLRSLHAAWPFLLICSVALVSTSWSVDPWTSLRRSFVLFGTTLFGVYLGGRYSAKEFQKVLLQSLLIMLGASFIMLIVMPDVVLDPTHAGTFRGLTEHKNYFGEYVAVLLLLGVCYDFKRRWRFARPAIILLAAAMQFWAHSATSLLAVSATMLMLPVLYLCRLRKRQALALVFAAMIMLSCVFFLVSKVSSTILEILDKDSTLTGRSDVWDLVWQAILRRPLLGYGYDAFWQGRDGESYRIVSVVGWNVAHSHNGYLEALLGFGVLGSLVIAFAILRVCRDAFVYVRLQRTVAGLWPSAFLLFYLVHATAEAGLIKRDGFSYLLVVVLATSLSLRRTEESARHGVQLSPLLSSSHGPQLFAPGLLIDSGQPS
jgi:exopolysaccharide production protein ExoQ